jgi:MFS family permease
MTTGTTCLRQESRTSSANPAIAARAVQGFATGVATAALGAAIMDVDRRRGAVLNSVTVFAGLTVGTLGAATLVTFAPDPTHLVNVVFLALSGIEALVIWHLPETAQTKPGALASLRPHVRVRECYTPQKAIYYVSSTYLH